MTASPQKKIPKRYREREREREKMVSLGQADQPVREGVNFKMLFVLKGGRSFNCNLFDFSTDMKQRGHLKFCKN